MSCSKTPHLQEAALIHSHLALHALHGLLNALQATEAVWLWSLSHTHTPVQGLKTTNIQGRQRKTQLEPAEV